LGISDNYIYLTEFGHGADVVVGFCIATRVRDSVPETVGLEPRKGMGYGGLVADVHDRIPIFVTSIAQFKRRLDKIFDALPLGKNFPYR